MHLRFGTMQVQMQISKLELPYKSVPDDGIYGSQQDMILPTLSPTFTLSEPLLHSDTGRPSHG